VVRHSVAILDSDSGFVEVLANRLDAAGWDVRTISDASSLEALAAMRTDSLLLDIATHGRGGWGYLERVRARLPRLHVVVCTRPSSVALRVRGLRLGIDAWLTKPCDPEEVVVYVEVGVRPPRRDSAPLIDQPVVAGELAIHPDLYQVFVGGHSLEFTLREYEVLCLLLDAKEVVPREAIYELLWGYSITDGDRSVDQFVHRIRRKLRLASPNWTYVHTKVGVGYRFAPIPNASRPDGGVAAPRRGPPSPALGPGDAVAGTLTPAG
jgi:two-component system, OmpR family, alkaline phosphatase synthesis response regulator PhoP